MATWSGAIVRVENPERFVEAAAAHGITVAATGSPWILIEGHLQLGRLGPPPFAEALSRELHTTVVAFFVQTTVSNERVEHWQDGQLARELEFAADEGGWIARAGAPQPWEPSYFFTEEEGTAAGQDWPFNLREDISDDEIRRYERAKAAGDAMPILDLLDAGSTRAVARLCQFLGVDPHAPGALHRAPTNWKPRLVLAAILVLFIGACVLGALTRP